MDHDLRNGLRFAAFAAFAAWGVAVWILVIALVRPGAARAFDGEIGPGSYCTLPAPGEKPSCLAPARADHESFFESVEAGRLDPDAASRLEADLVSEPGSQDAYLALSSIAYGYLQLSRSIAAEPEASPVLIERLEHWNGLLSSAYATDSVPEHFKDAVRVAAEDIHSRVSGFGAECGGVGRECSSGLLLALHQVDEGGPLRGPLRSLIDRIRGADDTR